MTALDNAFLVVFQAIYHRTDDIVFLVGFKGKP